MFKSIKKWFVDLALGYAKDFITVDQLCEWTVDAVNLLIKKATKDIDPEKMATTCRVCSQVSMLCGTLSTALGDRVISPDEAKKILDDIRDIFDISDLTDEKIAGMLDKLGEEIKSRI